MFVCVVCVVGVCLSWVVMGYGLWVVMMGAYGCVSCGCMFMRMGVYGCVSCGCMFMQMCVYCSLANPAFERYWSDVLDGVK